MPALSRPHVARGPLRLVGGRVAPSRPSRRERRLDRRARAAERAREPLSAAARAHDPLAHRHHSRLAAASLIVLLVVLGIAAHVGLVLVAFGVSSLRGDGKERQRTTRERIELRSVEVRKGPEALPEHSAKPRPVAPPPARSEPPPAARPAEPPRGPVASPAPDASTPAPRRIVGLSLESTVAGGGGPGFAVGNTRMGDTAARAEDPLAVGALPSGNRVAVRAPATGVAFVAPRKLAAITPDYPAALETQGIEGDVVVRVEIDASGTVVRAAVLKSSGYPELDAAATRASGAERWSPATRDGEPVADVLTFTIRFRLTSG